MWLLFRYGSYPRNRPTTISFRNYRFDVPDAFSFVWQIKEIFADEFYCFKATTPQPLILDCGANIGTSITYFKQLYPDARIIAFEADAHIGQVLAQNLRQNNLRGVEIVNKAVWTHNNGFRLAAAMQMQPRFSPKVIKRWCRRYGCATTCCGNHGLIC